MTPYVPNRGYVPAQTARHAPRICKLDGCDLPVSSPRAEFCKPAHRAAFWRTQHVNTGPVGPGPRSGDNNRSGSQVSLRKAEEVLATWLEGSVYRYGDAAQSRRTAELILRGALSERQAERERQRER